MTITTYGSQGQKDRIGAMGVFTVTNYAGDLTLDATEETAANIAATLASVIRALQAQGILKGTTATADV